MGAGRGFAEYCEWPAKKMMRSVTIGTKCFVALVGVNVIGIVVGIGENVHVVIANS